MKRILVGVFMLLSMLGVTVIAGCVSSAQKPTATSVPTLPPDVTSRLERSDVFCPTKNELARQSYNDALESQARGKLEDAKQLYLKAVELDPGYCDAMDNLGQLLRSQGNIEEAISWYKKSITILPGNVVAHQNLALAYRIQGKIADAIAEYQLLVQIDSDNPEGYYGLGSIYVDMKRPQDAVMQLKKAEELYAGKSSPLITDARHLLGVSYYMLQEYERARDYFEQVYLERRDDPGINYLLGLCYLSPRIKNLELARKYLGKAQELGVNIPANVLEQLK
jgi:tetratricopeptide (TPR) repeat protein